MNLNGFERNSITVNFSFKNCKVFFKQYIYCQCKKRTGASTARWQEPVKFGEAHGHCDKLAKQTSQDEPPTAAPANQHQRPQEGKTTVAFLGFSLWQEATR